MTTNPEYPIIYDEQFAYAVKNEKPIEGEYALYDWLTDKDIYGNQYPNWQVGVCKNTPHGLSLYFNGVIREKMVNNWMALGMGTKTIIASNNPALIVSLPYLELPEKEGVDVEGMAENISTECIIALKESFGELSETYKVSMREVSKETVRVTVQHILELKRDKVFSQNNADTIRNKIIDLMPTGDITLWDNIKAIKDYTTWFDKYIQSILTPKPVSCEVEIVHEMTAGWVPTYNDPDNNGCAPSAEPTGRIIYPTYKKLINGIELDCIKCKFIYL